jgi:hypothetical protein
MSSQEDLYDEFGNYIGPELRDSSDEEVSAISTPGYNWVKVMQHSFPP